MSAFVFYILFVIESVEKREVTDAEVFLHVRICSCYPISSITAVKEKGILSVLSATFYVNLILICLVTVCQMYAAIAVKH